MILMPILFERELLTARDVAYRLNISERTVWRWVASGRLPPPVRYSTRVVRWRVQEIEDHVSALNPDGAT